MNRRSFLSMILAAGAAPWVARAGVLMPVQAPWVPPSSVIKEFHVWPPNNC